MTEMGNKNPIYMDYHATTPVDPQVLEVMLPFFTEHFGNAGSIDHYYGVDAANAVKIARKQVAHCINAPSPDDIIFTSGATESNNIAILGAAEQYASEGNHIITCATEHKAVLNTCKHLATVGKDVTFLPVDQYGMIDLDTLEAEITDRTVLISIMAANNEIGTIAPIAEIGSIAHKHGVLFHTDAAQAVGHIPIDVEQMGIDLLSISGHKIYGPKGVGALYIRRRNPRVRLAPIIFGGEQERGYRSGTMNVPGVVGLGRALEVAEHEMVEEERRFRAWTSQMFEAFQGTYEQVLLNGHPTRRLAHNLNVCFPGIESKALIHLLRDNVAISAGSACTTTNVEPSHVLLAIGRTEQQAHSSLRFGVGRFNTNTDIDETISSILPAIKKLKMI